MESEERLGTDDFYSGEIPHSSSSLSGNAFEHGDDGDISENESRKIEDFEDDDEVDDSKAESNDSNVVEEVETLALDDADETSDVALLQLETVESTLRRLVAAEEEVIRNLQFKSPVVPEARYRFHSHLYRSFDEECSGPFGESLTLAGLPFMIRVIMHPGGHNGCKCYVRLTVDSDGHVVVYLTAGDDRFDNWNIEGEASIVIGHRFAPMTYRLNLNAHEATQTLIPPMTLAHLEQFDYARDGHLFFEVRVRVSRDNSRPNVNALFGMKSPGVDAVIRVCPQNEIRRDFYVVLQEFRKKSPMLCDILFPQQHTEAIIRRASPRNFLEFLEKLYESDEEENASAFASLEKILDLTSTFKINDLQEHFELQVKNARGIVTLSERILLADRYCSLETIIYLLKFCDPLLLQKKPIYREFSNSLREEIDDRAARKAAFLEEERVRREAVTQEWREKVPATLTFDRANQIPLSPEIRPSSHTLVNTWLKNESPIKILYYDQS